MTLEDYVPFMQEAIALARQVRLKTCPNPAVGAMLLRDGVVVARGRHRGASYDHAEVDCLNNARSQGIDTKGCTLVVTLEPCRHEGKHPPCTTAIIEAGITRVVYGLNDPNPQAGGGACVLRQAGLEVLGPLCEQQCRDLVADFLIWQSTQRPYILLKMAATLDGRIATRNGLSRWISCDASRHKVQELRAAVGQSGGAVLIGGGTFRADNPTLTARDGYTGRQPLACLLTSRLPKVDADFHLLRQRPEETIFLASPAASASAAAQELRHMGVRVLPLGPSQQGGPDFAKLFSTLRQEFHCSYVLCEGGGKLALALLEAGYVDEFHLHLAPLILGDDAALPLFTGRTPHALDEGLHMRITEHTLCGSDVHLILRPQVTHGES